MPDRIDKRIDAALGGRSRTYHTLALDVFPPGEYPRALRCAVHGGPPGCYMALSSAVRRYGFSDWYSGKTRMIGPREKINA